MRSLPSPSPPRSLAFPTLPPPHPRNSEGQVIEDLNFRGSAVVATGKRLRPGRQGVYQILRLGYRGPRNLPPGAKDMTDLSVVVPLYNECKSIEPLLAALLAALEALDKDFEIIVVDDGSTDGGPDLVRRRAALDDRLTPPTGKRSRRCHGQTNI
jgi:hypothetical protein